MDTRSSEPPRIGRIGNLSGVDAIQRTQSTGRISVGSVLRAQVIATEQGGVWLRVVGQGRVFAESSVSLTAGDRLRLIVDALGGDSVDLRLLEVEGRAPSSRAPTDGAGGVRPLTDNDLVETLRSLGAPTDRTSVEVARALLRGGLGLSGATLKEITSHLLRLGKTGESAAAAAAFLRRSGIAISDATLDLGERIVTGLSLPSDPEGLFPTDDPEAKRLMRELAHQLGLPGENEQHSALGERLRQAIRAQGTSLEQRLLALLDRGVGPDGLAEIESDPKTLIGRLILLEGKKGEGEQSRTASLTELQLSLEAAQLQNAARTLPGEEKRLFFQFYAAPQTRSDLLIDLPPEREAEGDRSKRGTGQPLRAIVRLDSPALGAVEITLDMSGKDLGARLVAKSQSTLAALESDWSELARALQALDYSPLAPSFNHNPDLALTRGTLNDQAPARKSFTRLDIRA